MKCQKNRTVKILMCGSNLKLVKGGIVSVVNSILSYPDWDGYEYVYIPTHLEAGSLRKLTCFCAAYLKAAFCLLFTQVDIVHLHVSERGSFYRKAAILRLAKWRGKPVILHHHGADFQIFYDSLSEKKKRYVRKILESADRNILLSEQVEKELHKKAPEARTEVLHNSVKVPENNRYDCQGNCIVTLGRLGERKGTYDLLRAMKEIDGEIPENIRICLCGDGETEAVNKLVDEYGLRHRVQWVGWVSGEQKEAICKQALCHVLPSYREVLPMSILETMALGIPNISTGIASIPEVIEDGINGCLVEPGDVEALQTALKNMCADREMRKSMSRQAYLRIKTEYSREVCFDKLKKIYQNVRKGCR